MIFIMQLNFLPDAASGRWKLLQGKSLHGGDFLDPASVSIGGRISMGLAATF
jgi:hypothetical protein